MPVAYTPNYQWNDNDRLTLTAKVDTVTAPSHALFWECEFTPATEPDGLAYSIGWDGNDGMTPYSDTYLDGVWELTAVAGAFDAGHTVEVVKVDADMNPIGEPLAVFTALGQVHTLYFPFIPPNKPQQRARIWQPLALFPATLALTKVEHFVSSGQEPMVAVNGNQLNVIYDALPMRGLFTAHAAIYDDTGALLTISDSITLNIRA